MSHTYLIEALAPLVFRSGKPFGVQSGADGGNFPLPSSLAGLARTLYADQAQRDFSSDLRDIAVLGPLLARRSKNGEITPLLPRPADALYYKEGESAHIIRQAPVFSLTDCACDLPSGLLPVQTRRQLAGKPVPGPQYWPLQRLIEWGKDGEIAFDALKEEGLNTLDIEERIHVALERKTGASAEGQLFQTGGIDLSARRQVEAWAGHDLVLIGRADVELRDDLVNLGGERRLSRLHAVAENVWPAPPENLAEDIRSAGGLRLTFATPAIFNAGYLPGWLDETLTGSPPGISNFRLRLCAVAVERWLPVSGWDLAAKKPRAMRKAVAAGAVYWFECAGEIPEDFIPQLWLRPLSDQEQDRRDGFGLALPAPWTPIIGNG